MAGLVSKNSEMIERTGRIAAAAAGKILRELTAIKAAPADRVIVFGRGLGHGVCTVAELKTLAASALTQAPDRKKAG